MGHLKVVAHPHWVMMVQDVERSALTCHLCLKTWNFEPAALQQPLDLLMCHGNCNDVLQYTVPACRKIDTFVIVVVKHMANLIS